MTKPLPRVLDKQLEAENDPEQGIGIHVATGDPDQMNSRLFVQTNVYCYWFRAPMTTPMAIEMAHTLRGLFDSFGITAGYVREDPEMSETWPMPPREID